MTFIYALLMLIMLVFAGLQYNDPDGPYWALIYLVPAIALGLAAFVPHWLATLFGRILLVVAIVALGIGVFMYWPAELATIAVSDWMDNEAIREGFGIAVAYLFTCMALPLAFRSSVRRLKKAASDTVTQ